MFTLVTAAAIGGAAILSLRNSAVDRAEFGMDRVATQASAALAHRLDSGRTAHALAADYLGSRLLASDPISIARHVLVPVVATQTAISSAYYIDPLGTLTVVADAWPVPQIHTLAGFVSPTVPNRALHDPLSRRWFSERLLRPRLWRSGPRFLGGVEEPLSIVGPVFDRQRQFQGIVGIDLQLDDLGDLLADLPLAGVAAMHVIDAKGTILASQSERHAPAALASLIGRGGVEGWTAATMEGLRADIRQYTLEHRLSGLQYRVIDRIDPLHTDPGPQARFHTGRDPTGITRTVGVLDLNLDGLEWQIAIAIRQSQFFALNQTTATMAVMTLIIVAIAGLFGLWWSGRVARALEELRTYTQAVATRYKTGRGVVFGAPSIEGPTEVREALGAVIALVGSLARERSGKEALADDMQKLGLAVQEAPVGIVLADVNGNVRDANPAFCWLAGYDTSLPAGTNLASLLSAGLEEGDRCGFRAAITGQGPWRGDIRFTNGSGDCRVATVSIATTQIGYSRDKRVLVIADDVTERVVAEREAQSARKAAEAASRAKSRFLAQMTHELRTPLNAVIGFGELISSGVAAGKTKQYAGFIGISGRHLLGIVEQILDHSQLESAPLRLKEEATSLSALIEDAAHLASLPDRTLDRQPGPMVSPDHRVVIGRVPPVTVFGDATRMRQVLINLISNAILYTPGDDQVTVDASIDRDSGDLVIAVRDRGVGIPKDRVGEVFAPFSRIKDPSLGDVGGVGLGLTIALRLVQAHDGTLTLDRRVGGGTVALVRLPGHRYANPRPALPDQLPAVAVGLG